MSKFFIVVALVLGVPFIILAGINSRIAAKVMDRFSHFLVVALAWGVPFIFLLGANSSAASYPMLARKLESLTWPYLWFMPSFFAIVGVLLVAWVSRYESSFSKPADPMMVLLAFSVIAIGIFGAKFALYSLATNSADINELLGYFIGLILLGLILTPPLYGIIVTTNTFWRRSRLLAIIWLLGYALTVFGIFWLTGKTNATEKDLGAGLIAVFGIGILLAVSISVSAIVSSIAIYFLEKKNATIQI